MAEKLTPRQMKALESLLSGASIRKAAQLSHVGERTLYRWMEQPLFVSSLKASESRILDGVTIRLMGLAGKALDVLSDILENGGGAPGANVKRLAAANVLQLVEQYLEMRSFEERLSRLEVHYAKSK